MLLVVYFSFVVIITCIQLQELCLMSMCFMWRGEKSSDKYLGNNPKIYNLIFINGWQCGILLASTLIV